MKQLRAGDLCEVDKCGGRLVVYKTRINFAAKMRIRYLHCPKCGHCPDGNKWLIPLEYSPQRFCKDY